MTKFKNDTNKFEKFAELARKNGHDFLSPSSNGPPGLFAVDGSLPKMTGVKVR